MLRDIITNKWILGAIGFIILFAGVCYLWYQHQLAPYEKQAADTAEIVHQLEKNQQVQRKSSAAERTTEEGLTDSDTPMPDDTAAPQRVKRSPRRLTERSRLKRMLFQQTHSILLRYHASDSVRTQKYQRSGTFYPTIGNLSKA